MSFTVSPVSAVFPTPVVAGTHNVADRDRQHAQDEANRHRQAHPHPHPPTAGEAPVATPEAEPSRTLGTLIDVRG